MKAAWPVDPAPINVGAKPLNIAITMANPPSVRARPTRSAMTPDATMAPAAMKPPRIWIIRKPTID